jgi:hypothetical protein
VVSDAQVLVAEIAGGFGHLGKGVRPVRKVGMGVKDALQVLCFDKLRRLPRLCLGDFAITLTQFRRDVRQSKAAVDRLFRAACRLSAGFAEALRAQGQVLAAREGLQLLQVLLVAGRVQQSASECLRGDNAHPHNCQALLGDFLACR